MPQFYFRPGHAESQLIRDCAADAFDAAIVLARYIASDPEADPNDSGTHDLVNALSERGDPWIVDLATPQLCDDKINDAEGCARLRATDFARVLPLPLDPARLEDEETRNAFVDACVAFQQGAPMLSPPYLEVESERDPRLATNVAMMRRVVGAATGKRLVAGFVQLTLESLKRINAAALTARYAETGVTLVFLRVRNLRAEEATASQLRSYLDVVDAFKSEGIGVVADQAGRLGPPVVAGGAVGFSAGSQFFRGVPRRVVSLGGGGGGTKLPVEIPGRWAATPRDQLPQEFDCPVPGCRAKNDRSTSALREHNLHYLRYLGQLAVDPSALVADLRASGEADALAWAQVLASRFRLSA